MPSCLVLCAHGTRSEAGRAAVRAVVDAVSTRWAGPVQDAYVDVHGPALGEVLGPRSVVVPLLLSPGYHVRVDIAGAVEAAGGDRAGIVVAGTLGPSRLLVDLLAERVRAVGLASGDAVVLAAAGSSEEKAATSVEAVARALSVSLGRPVGVGYGAARAPSVADEVSRLRRSGARRVVVASYLLAPGHFHRRLEDSGADAVTAPLVEAGTVDGRLVDLVLLRALAASRRPTTERLAAR